MIRALLLVLVVWGVSASASELPPQELTLGETLRLAEEASPALKASVQREREAGFATTIARSDLLPKLDLSAVDSWGFPGSSSPVPPEFGGLLTSPYRVGAAAGVTGRLTLFDLSDWRGLEEAKDLAAAATEETRIARLRLDQTAADLFFEAANLRGESEAWKNVVVKLEPILATVRKFVRNGQVSDVQRLLLEDQLDEAQMQEAVADEHYQIAIKRLGLLLNRGETAISCPPATRLDASSLGAIAGGGKSPLLSHAEAAVRAAQAGASKFAAKHLPKLYALGSAAFMENARLVDQQDYSVWIGLTLPLFEGFRISAQAERAEAIAGEREDDLSATRLALGDLDARYEDTIDSSRIRLEILDREHSRAIGAFELARKRYLAFLEPVLNLKEAVRNLARIETQLSEANAALLRAETGKLILNGGTVVGR